MEKPAKASKALTISKPKTTTRKNNHLRGVKSHGKQWDAIEEYEGDDEEDL
jgi:hypothetical protein